MAFLGWAKPLVSQRLLWIILPKGTHQPIGVGRDLHGFGLGSGLGSGQTGPAGSRCPIQLIQAGPLAAVISQESVEVGFLAQLLKAEPHHLLLQK
jgi:hypothetical protein